ncbi:MAG: TetR-like C-terminal domain-containing protein [Lachnospiraceae bacterium]|nr:TetR-like C-terminal domain-containing protein [Lachnospiraceae bacterium]
MAQKTDRRIRKTRAQLRSGLAKLMQKKSVREITVKELVDEVDINRSTFYLHYSDIYQMLESIEAELEAEVIETIQNHPLEPVCKDTSSFVEQFFIFLEKNQDICCALLGPHGDMAFVTNIERIIAENMMSKDISLSDKNILDIAYASSFCLSGCVGLIQTWLNGALKESPQHMAKLTHSLITHTTHDFVMRAAVIMKQ